MSWKLTAFVHSEARTHSELSVPACGECLNQDYGATACSCSQDPLLVSRAAV